MKAKSLFAAAAFAAVALLSACGTATSAVKTTEATNYFVRNDVTDYSPRLVTSKPAFDSLFGAAPVIGEGGLPTAIDFSKQNVVALIAPPTDVNTEIRLDKVSTAGGKLTVNYELKQKGEKMTYTMVPCRLFAVDKSYGNEAVFVKK